MTPTVSQQEYFHLYNGGKSYRNPPVERQTLTQVSSIAQMDALNTKPSWYFDGEWLHFKSVGEYERSEGGWLIDNRGKNITYDANEDYRCHKQNGCQALRFTVDNTNANRQACGPLPTVQPTTTFSTKRKLLMKIEATLYPTILPYVFHSYFINKIFIFDSFGFLINNVLTGIVYQTS